MGRLIAGVVIVAVVAVACSGSAPDRSDESDALVEVVASGRGSVSGPDSSGELDALVEVVESGRGSVRARSEGVVGDAGGDVAGRVFVEIGARRGSGGGVEVGLRVNATATVWLPAERVFNAATAPVGVWWSSSSAGSGDAGAESVGVGLVRVRVRRVDDGRL